MTTVMNAPSYLHSRDRVINAFVKGAIEDLRQLRCIEREVMPDVRTCLEPHAVLALVQPTTVVRNLEEQF